VLLRGELANVWELRTWELLLDRYDVEVVVTPGNRFDLGDLKLARHECRRLREMAPRGRAMDMAVGLIGDRYLGLEDILRGADIVHAAELGFWFSRQAAQLKRRLGYRLALTVWETLPLRGAYRSPMGRRIPPLVAREADVLLPTTERARAALALEGVDDDRIAVCPPAIDIERFRAAPATETTTHELLSPGRLVWEKGHQDVIRALAALRRGVVDAPEAARHARLTIIGSGPEEKRLRQYAAELGVGDAVTVTTAVPYAQMPAIYGRASAMVLASIPTIAWEEQFGMVLAEAMAARLPIVASACGAITEVTGPSAAHFPPGEWLALAHTLAREVFTRPPGTRVDHPRERLDRYSLDAMAGRLDQAYQRILAR
jgi:glycosyltransferase involved in cell wall biosynthesis